MATIHSLIWQFLCEQTRLPWVHRIQRQGLTEVKQQLQDDLLIRSMQNKVVMGGEWTHQRGLGNEYMDLSRSLFPIFSGHTHAF